MQVDSALFYTILLILCSGIGLVGYLFHLGVEESTIITLRLRLSIMFAVTLIVPMYCYFFFDLWYYGAKDYFNVSFRLDDLHYYTLLALFGALTLYRFFRYSHFEDLVFLALSSLFLLRFLVVTEFKWHIFFWVFYFFILYYGIFLVRYWTSVLSERLALGGVLAVVSWLLLFFLVDGFRENGYYMTYLSCVFMATLWVRYLWNLEYKRRKRCPNCGGWGKLGIKEKKRFWWAVGYKESSGATPCQNCGGKGWFYRYPDLFHAEK